MAKVAEYKKKVVKNILDLISQYPIVAAINMENLPAQQLQKMRAELREMVVMTMTKRRIIKIAFKEAEKTKKGIEELSKHLEGMPALMFSKENPFKLFKTLQKNKSPAPAKANQTAPKDLIIPAGPTPFAPGPVIGELAMIGIKSGVEDGKVAIKEDAVVAKKGEKISQKAAEILTRLEIKPMEVGLDLVAAYEGGTIYTRDILSIDEDAFMNNLQSAGTGAFNLAMFMSYPTSSTVEHLISKAANDAKALGISQNIIDKDMVDMLIGKAEGSMNSLKTTANIEVVAKPKAEEKKEEPKVEEKAPEPVKEEPKVEEKAPGPVKEEPKSPEPKVEEKTPEPVKGEPKPEPVKTPEPKVKEEPKVEEPKPEPVKAPEPKAEEKPVQEPTPIEKKEIKVLEEEKEIIKEEKELETQKQPDTQVEKEVQEAVKVEEEKQLEKERIDKEKELEKIEKQRQPEMDETAKKVAAMVAKVKKQGTMPSAEQLVEEAKSAPTYKPEPKLSSENEKGLEKPRASQREEKIPTAQELVDKKEEKSEEESAEDLLNKLKKQGTLRE